MIPFTRTQPPEVTAIRGSGCSCAENLDLNHAEPVPLEDMVFYLHVQVVYQHKSTTTKVRAVLDASAKSTTGVSLNHTLMVGPTVHSQLSNVLLRFRLHQVTLTADTTKCIEPSNSLTLIETTIDSCGERVPTNP